MTDEPAGRYIHANALILGETGLLLRGPSGCGKSALTLALIARFQLQGDFARLVGDDRIALEAADGRLFARPHPSIAGMIEARGMGLLRLAYEEACVIGAVVDISGLGKAPARCPETDEKTVELNGIQLPRLCILDCSDVSVARIGVFAQMIRTI